MKTAIELNAFIAQNRTYCVAAAKYNNLVNSFVSVLSPSEDVMFIAGTDTIQDANGVKTGFALVAITTERIVYGAENAFMQYTRDKYVGVNNQVVNNEGWVTVTFSDSSFMMFKTLGAMAGNSSQMINESLDENAMAAKKDRELAQRQAAAIALDKKHEIQREHFEYDIQTIQTPEFAPIDKARMAAIIADYTGRGYKLHTMTSNAIIAMDGSKAREDILVFERKYR